MRMLVLGAGLQGSACAYDLLQRPDVERVTLADLHPTRAAPFLKKKKSKRLVGARLDARRGPQLGKLMRGHDAVMNALPYYFNYPVTKAAIAAGLIRAPQTVQRLAVSLFVLYHFCGILSAITSPPPAMRAGPAG